MLRSTNQTYGSDPNIHKLNIQDTEFNITTRKRKHDDEYALMFKSFSEEIMSTLKIWKEDIDKNVAQINENINTIIKDDLAKLTQSTQDIKSEINSLRNEYSVIKETVSNLKKNQDDVKADVLSLQESLEFNSGKIVDFEKNYNSLRHNFNQMKNVETDLAEIKNENRKLKNEMNDNAQRDRLSNIEIIGLPETKDEDLFDYIRKIAKCIGADLAPEHIVTIHRVTPKIKTPGRSRAIIVKTKTRLQRDNFLSRAKKCKITTNDIDIPGNIKSIFINEHLTPFNQQLLKFTKETAKTKLYQYTWSKNGRIYVRKSDTSAQFMIKDAEDLKKML